MPTLKTLKPVRIRVSIKYILSKIKSDGCTGVPDFNFITCCIYHDWRYKNGGSEFSRKHADKLLFKCIRKKAGIVLASVYYLGVRWFGKSHFNYKK